MDLAEDYERRMLVQADIQEYVDQAISSTINLPKWGSKRNSPDTVRDFAATLARYAPRLRGFTCYTVAAGLFTAEEVGASHRRERLFIVAQSDLVSAGKRSWSSSFPFRW